MDAKDIEETINKWFDEVQDKLRKHGLQTGFDELIFAALGLLDNYFNCALMILNKGSRLPAMALFRCTGEFIAKITYCLQGENGQGLNTEERVESWRKLTLEKDKDFCKSIIDKYTGDDRNNVQKRIDKIDEEIAKIITDKLSSTATIFEEVFAESFPFAKAGMYQQFLGAVHLDLKILAETIGEKESVTEYIGDIEDYDIEELKFNCVTQFFYFLRAVYNYYGLKNFDKIENEYKTLIPAS